jgi:hypothetical protein
VRSSSFLAKEKYCREGRGRGRGMLCYLQEYGVSDLRDNNFASNQPPPILANKRIIYASE